MNDCKHIAYGGFGITTYPNFQLNWFFFVNSSEGILAVANIRGGCEYGENWHSAGRLLEKQNCYDVFNAAAEYLIGNEYTTREKLVIRRASNGGLMIGVSINQRPDLFAANCGSSWLYGYDSFS